MPPSCDTPPPLTPSSPLILRHIIDYADAALLLLAPFFSIDAADIYISPCRRLRVTLIITTSRHADTPRYADVFAAVFAAIFATLISCYAMPLRYALYFLRAIAACRRCLPRRFPIFHFVFDDALRCLSRFRHAFVTP